MIDIVLLAFVALILWGLCYWWDKRYQRLHHGATIFVDVRGYDRNPGTQARPMRTPAAAIKLLAGSGTVRLGPGEYTCHGILLTRAVQLIGAGWDKTKVRFTK